MEPFGTDQNVAAWPYFFRAMTGRMGDVEIVGSCGSRVWGCCSLFQGSCWVVGVCFCR